MVQIYLLCGLIFTCEYTTATTCTCTLHVRVHVELAPKGVHAHVSAVKGILHRAFESYQVPDGFAMTMSPNKDETAVHGCHCRGDMTVRTRKV